MLPSKGYLSLVLLKIVSAISLPKGIWPPLVFPEASVILALYPPEYPYNGIFSTDVIIGSQTIHAVLDTGSSNTFVLTPDTNCTQVKTLQPRPESECGYAGPRYTVENTFEVIPDMNFNDTYGFSGDAYGKVGYERFDLGGIVIPKQEFSPLTYASFANYPQGNVSGLLGLAFESRTRTYPGTDPLKDMMCSANTSDTQDCGPVYYSPILTTIFNSGLADPYFAFALSRSTIYGGVLTIGGIPDLNDPKVNVTLGPTVTTALEPFGNETVLSWYVISVDRWMYPNNTSSPSSTSPNLKKLQYIIDSGTGPNVLPSADAKAINALFSPPATFNTSTSLYQVHCNATPPSNIGVTINGVTFYHNPKDLVMSPSEGEEYCLSGIQGDITPGSDLLFLGATFMKSVLAVFDVGGSAVTFASRAEYDDE